MEKFLIEVPHEETESECINAVRIFYQTGSHFLTNADWGCEDGEHKAWLLVDVENKDKQIYSTRNGGVNTRPLIIKKSELASSDWSIILG